MVSRKALLRRIKDGMIVCAQIACHVVCGPIIRMAIRAELWLPENIKDLERGALFVANHRSKMDPFVVLAYVPLSVFIKILPIRFPVDNDFMRLRHFRYTLPLVGAYDIGGSPREKMLGMLRTKQYLEKRTTVFLFPEGKINRESMGELQKGLEFFLGKGQKVMLVRIDGLERSLGALFRKGNELRFSQIFNDQDENLEISAVRTFISAS